MLEIRRPEKKPVVVIRAASGHELSTYEKRKLSQIDDKAQENKIEVIKLNGKQLQIDAENKEVCIDVGELAFKDAVKPDDLSANDLFLIKCALDESDLIEEVK